MLSKNGVVTALELQSQLSRVDFGTPSCQKAFFRQAKSYTTWKDFYNELMSKSNVPFTFRMFRRWYLGYALPIAEVVNKICNLTGQDLTRLCVTYREPNWGRKKGGISKATLYDCNLTMRDRMIGGTITGRSNSHDRMRFIASIGGSNSVKSCHNPWRRVLGPNQIRMFNRLEKQTMELVLQHAKVDYEPVIKIGQRQRIIPDFRVGRTYIECTADPKANVKGPRLRERFQLLKRHIPIRKSIVVTLPHLVPKYMHYLAPDVEVVSLHNLKKFLNN